jgi:hypothetical protein
MLFSGHGGVSSVRELYSSSNGDRWEAGRDELGRLVIIHTPNVPSGGKPKLMDIGAFLAADHYGPEHEALVSIILQKPRS